MEFYKSPNETSINTKTMTASYLWTYLISCRIKNQYKYETLKANGFLHFH